jgi:hypothetical protein
MRRPPGRPSRVERAYEVAIADEDLVVEERLCRADDIDMDPVVFKLTHPEQGGHP